MAIFVQVSFTNKEIGKVEDNDVELARESLWDIATCDCSTGSSQ